MATNIILVILVTSFATYISRFLGAFTSEKISDTTLDPKPNLDVPSVKKVKKVWLWPF